MRPAPSRSCLPRSSIRSARVSLPTSRIRGATLLASPTWNSVSLGKCWSCSRELRLMSPGPPRCSTRRRVSMFLAICVCSRLLHHPLGIKLTAAPVRDVPEIEGTVAELGHEPGGGLILPPEPFTVTHYKLITALAERHRLPAIYAYRSFVEEGGLMSYGPDPYDIFRRAASYVDRILRGEKPSDLPVQQPA